MIIIKSQSNPLIISFIFFSLVLATMAAPYRLTEEFITNYFTDDDIINNFWVYSGVSPPAHHYFT